MNKTFDIDLVELPAEGEFRAAWQELESRAQPTFYNSWSWIGTWLATLPESLRPRLWRARRDGQIVGLGLLVRRWRKRGPLPVCEAWYLNATGDFAQDIVWVEHNDLLVDARWADDIRAAMLAHWSAMAGPAAELRLPGLVKHDWCAAPAGQLELIVDVQSSCCVGLDAVREHKLDFMPLISSHARRFIRRSMKEYQTLGPLQLSQAESAEQAWDWFERLGELNQRRWIARGEQGVFHDAYFRTFHRVLIERCFASGEIQMLRVRAGESDVGLLYSFVHGGRVYVYQSGFDYGLLAKHGRPGMVVHTLAIQHNAALGHRHYDLMAGGESQYKSTLSTVDETLSWVVLRKPALRFRIEDRLHRIAKRHMARRAAASPAPVHDVGEASPA